jgi:hypothetical protein
MGVAGVGLILEKRAGVGSNRGQGIRNYEVRREGANVEH